MDRCHEVGGLPRGVRAKGLHKLELGEQVGHAGPGEAEDEDGHLVRGRWAGEGDFWRRRG